MYLLVWLEGVPKSWTYSVTFVGTDDSTDAETKKEICRNVFTLSYFKIHRQEDWFDTDLEQNFEELRDRYMYKYIFLSMYRKIENKSRWLPLFSDYEYVYENAYRRRPVYDAGVERGDIKYRLVFKCLVKNQSSRIIKTYFVSQATVVSFPEFNVVDIAGRYIFSGEILKLVVFAAESTASRADFEMDVQESSHLKDLAERKESLLYADVED